MEVIALLTQSQGAKGAHVRFGLVTHQGLSPQARIYVFLYMYCAVFPIGFAIEAFDFLQFCGGLSYRAWHRSLGCVCARLSDHEFGKIAT